MQLMSEGYGELASGGRTTGGPGAHRPLDLVHLARYTLGNRSLEREVLGLFCTQSKLYLERLKQGTGDKAWRDAAHTIKGSARSIGAWQVAQQAESAEALQGGALAGARGGAVALLEAAIAEVNAYIGSLLADD